MDITLIPQAESKYDKKHRKSFIVSDSIVRLTDCSLILLHKSGLRPLFTINTNNEEQILFKPKHKILEKPDLIIYNNTSNAGKQSARVIQEQLGNSNCRIKILGTNFSAIEKTKNLEMLRNILLTRASRLKENGYKHIVIVSSQKHLDKIAFCMNGRGLSQTYNVPIYSFSEGKEIEDVNLTDNFYITRDLLDNWLVNSINNGQNKEWISIKDKCRHPLSLYQIQKKLHFPE